jgi:hypothetical protein
MSTSESAEVAEADRSRFSCPTRKLKNIESLGKSNLLLLNFSRKAACQDRNVVSFGASGDRVRRDLSLSTLEASSNAKIISLEFPSLFIEDSITLQTNAPAG